MFPFGAIAAISAATVAISASGFRRSFPDMRDSGEKFGPPDLRKKVVVPVRDERGNIIDYEYYIAGVRVSICGKPI